MTSRRPLSWRSSPDAGGAPPDWILLALACTAQFMVILDVSVVNVALPSIGRDLHYTATGLQWVVNAYVLTFAGFLLLGGRAADLYGRRRVFLFGLLLFSVSSLVGGFAQSSAWLTAARAAQGVGGAVLSPATLTIIITTFPPGPRMARALGLWSATGGAGGAAGVMLGGVLTAELSWRWVLFINVPIGAAAALVALAFLTEARGTGPRQRLDVAGAITVTAGMAVLVYAIVNTDTHPWGSAYTIVGLAIAAVLLGAFVLWQFRARATLVPLRLFRRRSVTGANVVMLLVGSAFFAMWYFLSLYLQDVLRFGPLRAGFAFLPMGLAIIVGAQGSSRILPRLGPRPIIAVGTAMAAGGFFWLSQITATSHYWDAVFGPGVIISCALGVLFTPLAAAGTMGVERSEAGLASGVLNTSRQVGGSLGLAILATLASAETRSALAHGVTQGPALTQGFARAFMAGGFIALAALAATRIVPGQPAAAHEAEADAAASVTASERGGPEPDPEPDGLAPAPRGSLANRPSPSAVPTDP
jgi:EmrB/QacA subfamily drug resistance transporter